MNTFHLIIQGVRYYWKKNLSVMLGIAVSMAVLTGALMVGDTMSWNLHEMVELRLGRVSHAVNSGDRYMSTSLAERCSATGEMDLAPVLHLQAMLIAGGGQELNKLNVYGIDDAFGRVTGVSGYFDDLADDEAIISYTIAERLGLKKDDEILLRITKASLVPMNAPFVADDGGAVAIRLKVKDIAGDEQLARFTLRVTQALPLNVFVSLEGLNKLMEISNKANILLANLSPGLDSADLAAALQHNWSLEDAQLHTRLLEPGGELSLVSERVFIDPPIVRAIEKLSIDKQFILTYFVNSISDKERSTPYSFVSSLPGDEVGWDEIVLNTWLAEDLGAQTGDSVVLRYFTVGPLRELAEEEAVFKVRSIVGIAGVYADKSLMPDIPGLSDAGNCKDWDTGIPIDLQKIRDKDEDYWKEYKGTPKAFINHERAVRLWQNRFGSCTDIRFGKVAGDLSLINSEIASAIEADSLGISVSAVKARGRSAAGEGVDFSQLFIGLSFFVLLAAVILTILLVFLNLDGRKEQVSTLAALGIPGSKIRKLLLGEQLILAIPGTVLGAFLSIAYNNFVFSLLNSLWGDIVRTRLVQPVVKPLTLIIGAVLTLVIVFITLWFSIGKMKPVRTNSSNRLSAKAIRLLRLLILLPALLAVALLSWQLSLHEATMPSVFFLSGGLLLLSLIGVALLLLASTGRRSSSLSILRLSFYNSARNRMRSMGVIALFSLGAFLVITTGANRQDLFKGAGDPHSGTGGFKWYAESSVPVLTNLNNEQVRMEAGLGGSFDFVQLSKAAGDDASCLNLNRISQPALLSVDPAVLNGRFAFVSSLPFLSKENPWSVLDTLLPSGLIPAVADETVIKWGLGLSVGDTLHYKGSRGESMDLLLVGGLSASIFQGYILISREHFLKYYPDYSGSSVFLVSYSGDNPDQGLAELKNGLRDYGLEVEDAAGRLAMFKSVTNTYLSIFMAMGALALMLGTVGLAIVMLRTLQERRSEFALLSALGYTRRKLSLLILSEFLWLLLAGVLIGSFTSVISTLPALLSPNTGVTLTSVLFITLLLVANGLFWLLLFTFLSVRRKTDSYALRNE